MRQLLIILAVAVLLGAGYSTLRDVAIARQVKVNAIGGRQIGKLFISPDHEQTVQRESERPTRRIVWESWLWETVTIVEMDGESGVVGRVFSGQDPFVSHGLTRPILRLLIVASAVVVALSLRDHVRRRRTRKSEITDGGRPAMGP